MTIARGYVKFLPDGGGVVLGSTQTAPAFGRVADPRVWTLVDAPGSGEGALAYTVRKAGKATGFLFRASERELCEYQAAKFGEDYSCTPLTLGPEFTVFTPCAT